MINSIHLYSIAQEGRVAAPNMASRPELASGISGDQGASGTQSGSTQISTLARQLAESANRADGRDKTLSRSELAAKATSVLNQVVGDTYYHLKEKHDSEDPKTSDPELLARAKQATAYVNDSSRGGHSEKNPFSGLSGEQLANIIYDESGTYTINERHAAYRESYDQEQAWREKVVAQAMAEYNSTGKLTNFFSSVLDHFKELPAIEQAQYPEDYASDLESKIKLDFNYRTHRAEGKDESLASVFDMLFPAKEEGAKSPSENEFVAQSNTKFPSTNAIA